MNNSIVKLLERAADKFPDKIALKDENGSRTYKEYMADAKRIATFLINNITHGELQQPIAVIIDRNIESIIAFIGCAYAGCFYVPIDSTMPNERFEKMLEALNPACVLDAAGLNSVEGTFSVSDIISEIKEIDDEAIENTINKVVDTDPLYALFTSGSTGVPKGVLVSHRSVVDLVEAFKETFGFEDDLVFGNQAPFDFDVSVKDIYNAMYCGGSVVIIPRRLFTVPQKL